MGPLAEGAIVAPGLRLVRKLGEGGMGSVWLADHARLKTQVVVKFMSEALAQVPIACDMFRKEAEAASRVRSPHVVQILDRDVTAQGLPYIVMELLEGEDLMARIDRVKRLPSREVAAIVAQIARALDKAHAAGVVHRDVKPHNVFLCDQGGGEVFVKVLDFGIAKARGVEGVSATRTQAVFGSAPYMSPEQVKSAKRVDHRADLWSLGVLAYQALTGTMPFDGETVGAVYVAICSGPIPRPREVDPSLPTEIDAWFEAACARDPNARFQSGRAMAEALATAAGMRASGMEIDRVSVPTPASAPTLPDGERGFPSAKMTTTGGMASQPIAGPLAPTSSRKGTKRLATALAAITLVGGAGWIAARAIMKDPVQATGRRKSDERKGAPMVSEEVIAPIASASIASTSIASTAVATTAVSVFVIPATLSATANAPIATIVKPTTPSPQSPKTSPTATTTVPPPVTTTTAKGSPPPPSPPPVSSPPPPKPDCNPPTYLDANGDEQPKKGCE